jgi:hypothetical protein
MHLTLMFVMLLRVYMHSLGSTTTFFCKIEKVKVIHLCVNYPFNALSRKKFRSIVTRGEIG